MAVEKAHESDAFSELQLARGQEAAGSVAAAPPTPRPTHGRWLC